ncbi:hypothetical protein ACWDG1_45555 [Streptomyces sp. NPDC001177]
MLEPDGEPSVSTAPDEGPAVPVFTASPYLDDIELPPHAVMSLEELIPRMPEGADRLLYLSPSSPVEMTVGIEALRAVLGAKTRADGATDDQMHEQAAATQGPAVRGE